MTENNYESTMFAVNSGTLKLARKERKALDRRLSVPDRLISGVGEVVSKKAIAAKEEGNSGFLTLFLFQHSIPGLIAWKFC